MEELKSRARIEDEHAESASARNISTTAGANASPEAPQRSPALASPDPPRATALHRATSLGPQPRAPAADLSAAARAIEAFLTALGHAPNSDPQLANTGALVAEAFHDEFLSGYRTSPAEVLSESVAASGGDLIVVRGIAITCMCPHHLLPSSGVVHVAYVPTTKVAGLGALSRLAQCLSRRLVLQETFCEQMAHALETELLAAGSGCIAELSAACLCARGERQTQARVVSVATRGTLQSDAQLRSEFFACARLHTGAP